MAKKSQNQAESSEGAPAEKQKSPINQEKLAAAIAAIRAMANSMAEKKAPKPEPEPDRIFALLDNAGRPQGFYTSHIHGEPPAGAIEITPEQHAEFLENQGRRALIQRGDGFALEEVEPVDNLTMEIVRLQRNALLTQSDWTQMPDSPLNDATKAKWAAYRQMLRDLPEGVGNDLSKVKWPNAPE